MFYATAILPAGSEAEELAHGDLELHKVSGTWGGVAVGLEVDPRGRQGHRRGRRCGDTEAQKAMGLAQENAAHWVHTPRLACVLGR